MNEQYLTVFSNIQPKDILSYLKRFGTVEKIGDYMGVSTVYEVAGNRFLIPNNTSLDDYPDAIEDVIRKISRIEKTSFDSILDVLELASVDILSFRNVCDETSDGTIPLWQCQKFVQGASDMVSAIACSASNHKRCYSGKKPQEAEDFFHRVKFGQTKIGSFIINLRCPIEPEFNITSLEDEEPYINRVLPLLDKALTESSRLASEALAKDDISELLIHPELGLSSNFYDALAQLYESTEKSRFTIKTNPAINRKRPFVPKEHCFNGEYIECFQVASKQIKESEPAPDQTVFGPVINIDQRPESEFKSVTIRDITGAKTRDIVICLKDEDYDKLYQNFKNDCIRVVGTIQSARGKKAKIVDYSSLEIILAEV